MWNIFYKTVANGLIYYFDSRIESTAVVHDRFAHEARLVENFDAIRREMRNLKDVPRFEDVAAEQKEWAASTPGAWRMLVLKSYGVWIHSNCSKLPNLSRLLADMPDVLSASISILEGGKYVPRHRGPFKGVLRYYFGVEIPHVDNRPGAILEIDGREHFIDEGAGLLWDDTFWHSVRNISDLPRVALLLDIRRPEMPLDAVAVSLMIRTLVSVISLARFRKQGGSLRPPCR
ncbi:aspartyl/asparaginyl beta-hydroxylase domain-containing protein [Achromobacter insolitus]|uniref:aspartyl/asparaginyl beta-hydroxylase domain-containing protein n=1 Tax=Achromobacter insolitus TaxID=217204 RepID=UPI003CC70A56